MGPDGILPTLLVLNAIIRLELPTDTPALSMLKCAIAIWKANKSTFRHFAMRQFCDAMLSRNSAAILELQKASIGLLVLIYQQKKYK